MDFNDDEVNEFENAEFMDTEASKFIKEGDIAGIKTGGDYPYYLPNLLRDPFEDESSLKDDYNHEFPPRHYIAKSNYLEIFKTKDKNKKKKKILISAFPVVGPTPISVIQKR